MTAARAEAMFASRVARLSLGVSLVPELPAAPELPDAAEVLGAAARGRARAARAGALAGGGFAAVFFDLRERGFGGLKRRLGLFERDFGALGVDFGEQLAGAHMLALRDEDPIDHAARLEAEVELAERLDVAGARDRRLHDSLRGAHDARGGRALRGPRPDDEHGGDDRPHAEQCEHDDEWPAAARPRRPLRRVERARREAIAPRAPIGAAVYAREPRPTGGGCVLGRRHRVGAFSSALPSEYSALCIRNVKAQP